MNQVLSKKNLVIYSGIVGFIGGLAFLFFNPIFLVISFICLLHIIQKSNSYKDTFLISSSFNFFYFCTHLYWICLAPKTVGMFYMVPFTFFGIPILASIFPNLALMLYHPFRNKKIIRVFAFTLLWSLGEWCRGNLLTGFPWNLNAYCWDLGILQSCSWWGIYGASLLVTFFMVSLFDFHKKFTSVVLCIFFSIWAYGKYKITFFEDENISYNVRLIQPCIAQSEKWDNEKIRHNFEIHKILSMYDYEKPVNAIIWSESSLPFLIESNKEMLEEIKNIIPENCFLITGGIRKDQNKIFNSLFVINKNGILDFYDKSHLVPFGEYIPLRSINPFPKITEGFSDYNAGDGIKTISVDKLPPFSPLICYEVIFPSKVVTKPRPDWIINITNDSWFGNTAGPKQHLKIAQVRAIEEGTPIVRVANNGISAVISPIGKILYRLNYNDLGFIDFEVPKKINSTFYSKHKSILFYIINILLLLIIIIKLSRRKNITKI